MKIEINNRTKDKIDLRLVKRAANRFALDYKIGGQELSVALVGDGEIKKLNRIYRGQNRATDILSFAGEGKFLGELVMDYQQIKRQAKQFGNSVNQELVFVLAHGLLHLVGYDDKTEKGRKKMVKLGEAFLEKL